MNHRFISTTESIATPFLALSVDTTSLALISSERLSDKTVPGECHKWTLRKKSLCMCETQFFNYSAHKYLGIELKSDFLLCPTG